MQDSATIAVALIFLVILLVLCLLASAIILRAAVWLYNKMAGGPNSPSAVPEPTMNNAMNIAFLATLVNTVVAVIVNFVVGSAAAVTGESGAGVIVSAQILSLPLSVLFMAGMLTVFLPTTFWRGTLVTLCHALIVVLIAGILGMVGAVAWLLG